VGQRLWTALECPTAIAGKVGRLHSAPGSPRSLDLEDAAAPAESAAALDDGNNRVQMGPVKSRHAQQPDMMQIAVRGTLRR
jgi:hypothetical protein